MSVCVHAFGACLPAPLPGSIALFGILGFLPALQLCLPTFPILAPPCQLCGWPLWVLPPSACRAPLPLPPSCSLPLPHTPFLGPLCPYLVCLPTCACDWDTFCLDPLLTLLWPCLLPHRPSPALMPCLLYHHLALGFCLCPLPAPAGTPFPPTCDNFDLWHLPLPVCVCACLPLPHCLLLFLPSVVNHLYPLTLGPYTPHTPVLAVFLRYCVCTRACPAFPCPWHSVLYLPSRHFAFVLLVCVHLLPLLFVPSFTHGYPNHILWGSVVILFSMPSTSGY